MDKDNLHKEIDIIKKDCKKAGWSECHDGEPITSEVVENAHRYIDLLKDRIIGFGNIDRLTNIHPDRDGKIAFVFNRERKRNVKGAGKFNYFFNIEVIRINKKGAEFSIL